MSEALEASDAGLGGGAAVSEPGRRGAIVRLRDRYANDEISLDEFSHALDGVLAAHTVQELSRASPAREMVAPVSRVSWLGAESLQQHLVPGEEILWVGRPEGNFPMAPGAVRTLWSIVGVIVLWEVWAGFVMGGTPWFGSLWGALVGLAMAYGYVGRYVRLARRTVYAITTRRIVRIIRRSSGEEMDGKLLRTLPSIAVSQGKKGRGTVAFDGSPLQPRIWGMRNISFLTETGPIGLINIAEPISVARLIGSLQAYREG